MSKTTSWQVPAPESGFVPNLRPHFGSLVRLDYVPSNEADGDRPATLIDCALGVSPFGPSPTVDVSALVSVHSMQNYPPLPYYALKDQITGYWSGHGLNVLGRSRLTVAAGSMCILDALCTLFVGSGDLVLGYSPQFPQFVNTVRIHGGRYTGVPLKPEHGYLFNEAEMIEAIRRERPVLVYIDNPNNPTGQIIPLAAIEAVLLAAASIGVTVVVDEAYGDFMEPSESAIGLLDTHENLLVTRTFSKGYGLAGLRVGYLATSEALNLAYSLVDDQLVNVAGIEAAHASLGDANFLPQTRALTASVKQRILEALDGFEVYPTELEVPIFTLVHPNPDINLKFELASRGVAATGGFEGLGPNAVRMRIPADPDPLNAILSGLAVS